jgi:hypothetical protein
VGEGGINTKENKGKEKEREKCIIHQTITGTFAAVIFLPLL